MSAVISRLRGEALAILDDPTTPVSLRQIAWRVLKQWGAA